jgi:hypothetical protein
VESEKGKVKREIQAFSKTYLSFKRMAYSFPQSSILGTRAKIEGENFLLGEGLGVGKDLSLPIQEATQIGRQ